MIQWIGRNTERTKVTEGERERERERGRQAGRQAGRQTERKRERKREREKLLQSQFFAPAADAVLAFCRTYAAVGGCVASVLPPTFPRSSHLGTRYASEAMQYSSSSAIGEGWNTPVL